MENDYPQEPVEGFTFSQLDGDEEIDLPVILITEGPCAGQKMNVESMTVDGYVTGTTSAGHKLGVAYGQYLVTSDLP